MFFRDTIGRSVEIKFYGCIGQVVSLVDCKSAAMSISLCKFDSYCTHHTEV